MGWPSDAFQDLRRAGALEFQHLVDLILFAKGRRNVLSVSVTRIYVGSLAVLGVAVRHFIQSS